MGADRIGSANSHPPNGPDAIDPTVDAHVKSPFHMNLGIQELRNFELFKSVTSALTLEDGQIVTFYETIKLLKV